MNVWLWRAGIVSGLIAMGFTWQQHVEVFVAIWFLLFVWIVWAPVK